jgi:hypothetical protein
MFIAYAVIAVPLALLLFVSARLKLTRAQRVIEPLTAAGVPMGMLPFLASCEVAGALGLLAGLWLGPLGVAAAIGVTAYFVGAVGAHLRTADFKGAPTPLVILIFAAAVLALRAATL